MIQLSKASVNSENFDQIARTRSLTRVFTVCINNMH